MAVAREIYGAMLNLVVWNKTNPARAPSIAASMN